MWLLWELTEVIQILGNDVTFEALCKSDIPTKSRKCDAKALNINGLDICFASSSY